MIFLTRIYSCCARYLESCFIRPLSLLPLALRSFRCSETFRAEALMSFKARILLKDVFYVHQVIRQNDSCCFPWGNRALQLQSCLSGPTEPMGFQVMVRQRSRCLQCNGLASKFCAGLSLLPEFNEGFSMLVNAHFQLAALCSKVSSSSPWSITTS